MTLTIRVSKRHIERTLKALEFERNQIPVDEPRSIELFGEIKALKDILTGRYAHVEGQ